LGLIIGLALLTFACEEPGEIGLNINPENGSFVARYCEIPLDNSITQHEDLLSDNATRIDEVSQRPNSDGRLLVGGFTTPEFGSFQSKSFSSIYPSLVGFNPTGFEYDSLVLYTRVDYLYGNDFLGSKRIFVHELSDEVQLDSLYLTKNSTPFNPDPIGIINFDVSQFDSTFVDTVFQTRISDEVGMRLFDRALTDSAAYFNNLEFRNIFNGLALVPEETNGVLAGIHAESQSTFMRMFIHKPDTTTFFDYRIEGFTFDTLYRENDTLFLPVNITRYYNNIELDRSGSAISGIPGFYEDYETDDNLTYIQGSAGVFTRLNFGSFYNFLDTVKSHVINRAELVMPINAYTDYLTPSSSLSLYATDESNRFVEAAADSNKIIYETIGAVGYSGLKNENSGDYLGDITTYIQDLSSGNRTDTLALLGQGALFNSVLSVNQTVIQKDKIYLRVYYSAIK